jgi:hypothetical protein
MASRHMPLIAIIALMSVVAGAAYYYQTRHPREIVGRGQITIERKGGSPSGRTLATRKIAIASTTFEEVALPNGTWIGCGGDCRAAAVAALDKFWDDQETRRK